MTDKISHHPKHLQAKAGLGDAVYTLLSQYLSKLPQGTEYTGLYALVQEEIEKPLLQVALEFSKGNQTKAAQMLGVNRNTLRKKIREYGISLKATMPKAA